MKKRYLLTPGPTMISPDTLLEMAKPIIHHRAPEFIPVMEEVREGLKYLFGTKNEVLIFAASGTGAMEGAVTNTLSPGDKALVVDGGKFGERWNNICKAYGINARVIKVEWGKAVNPSDIKKALDDEPDIKAVFIQASETSTGVMHPTKEIAEIVKNYENTILVVDGITGVGVFPLPMDEWGIDILITGSQKALMLPPGLAFAGLSDKAWKFVETSKLPKFYFDFKKELKNIKENQTAYTPAVSLIIGLREVLKNMKEEGLENIYKRHETLAKATREAMKAIGLKLFAPESPSNAVTAVYAPEGMDAGKIVKFCRDRLNVTITGGQDQAKGKIFRIAHLGYYDRFDIIVAISAIEFALKSLGYSFDFGSGVKKAMEILAD